MRSGGLKGWVREGRAVREGTGGAGRRQLGQSEAQTKGRVTQAGPAQAAAARLLACALAHPRAHAGCRRGGRTDTKNGA
eukprot:2365109-Rhodomonas_salina.2